MMTFELRLRTTNNNFPRCPPVLEVHVPPNSPRLPRGKKRASALSAKDSRRIFRVNLFNSKLLLCRCLHVNKTHVPSKRTRR